MTATIWVVVQHRDGAVHRMSREAIAGGQKLARDLGGSIEAIVLGAGVDAVAREVGGYQLDGVRVAESDALAEYTPGGYVGVLAGAIEAARPTHVVLAHSYQNIEFMARLAQAVGGSLLPEATDFEVADDSVIWTRPVLGGKLQAKVRATGAGPHIVSFQSGSFSGSDAIAGSAPVSPLDGGSPAPDREILGVEEVAGEQVDLSAADAVVAVGRGIGDQDKMGIVEELASALGAELGASRPVIDNGWLPRDRQIGSSGQTVAPRLYLAVGISGAIQHLVGMRGASTVVAINKDPGAPIFSVADYGVVGDLHEVVPALTAAVREARDAE